MTETNAIGVRAALEDVLTEVIVSKGLIVPSLEDATELLDGPLGLDSLDLAVVVVRLTEVAGRDPFAEGFVPFRTVGELVRLYSK